MLLHNNVVLVEILISQYFVMGSPFKARLSFSSLGKIIAVFARCRANVQLNKKNLYSSVETQYIVFGKALIFIVVKRVYS